MKHISLNNKYTRFLVTWWHKVKKWKRPSASSCTFWYSDKKTSQHLGQEDPWQKRQNERCLRSEVVSRPQSEMPTLLENKSLNTNYLVLCLLPKGHPVGQLVPNSTHKISPDPLHFHLSWGKSLRNDQKTATFACGPVPRGTHTCSSEYLVTLYTAANPPSTQLHQDLRF